jgi:hypothetical protein
MEDFEEDLEMFHEAMSNAYLLVTNRVSMENLYESLDKGLGHLSLPFDPAVHDGKSDDVLDMLVEYFIETEEYEKCSELMKIKKQLGKEIYKQL